MGKTIAGMVVHMRTLLALTLILGGAISYYFVQETPTQTVTSGTKKTTDRAEIISSKDYITLNNIKLAQLGDQTSADKSLAVTGDRVVLSPAEKNILSNTDKRFNEDTLILLAEVNPPVWKGQSLQASDLFITQLDTSKKIYVSYNTRGEPFSGAIQIIQLEGSGNVPKLMQTVIFTDLDIHSLTEKNGTLYLVGATGDEKFKTPAALEIIRLQNGLIPLPLNSIRVDLPSFAATSVAKVKDHIYVATGNKDGGIVEIRNPSSLNPGIVSYLNTDHTVYELDDARYLDYTSSHIFAVKGTDAGVWVLDRVNKTHELIHLSGATIPESKSTIEITPDKILLALGDGGTQILDLKNLKTLQTIPQAPHEDPSLSVTNAVSGIFREIFTADGEAGANIFQYSPTGVLKQVASFKFGAGKSVNAIKYYDGHLVLATGLGGVKIAKLFRYSSTIEQAETEKYLQQLRTRLADD